VAPLRKVIRDVASLRIYTSNTRDINRMNVTLRVRAHLYFRHCKRTNLVNLFITVNKILHSLWREILCVTQILLCSRIIGSQEFKCLFRACSYVHWRIFLHSSSLVCDHISICMQRWFNWFIIIVTVIINIIFIIRGIFEYLLFSAYSSYCGLVVRVPGYRSRGPGSIPGATRFSEL
jgi:hypothetical protein